MYNDYTLHKRPIKSGYVYYCHFRDQNGKRLSAISTGQRVKAAANKWAQQQIIANLLKKNEVPTFDEYASGWFNWDSCAYVSRIRSKKRYSRNYADNQRTQLLNNILPYFRDYRLDQIDSLVVDRWLIEVRDKKSSTTANRAFWVLKTMMREAVRQSLLSVSPVEHIEPLEELRREKGILTLEEIKALFNPSLKSVVWSSETSHYCLNAIASRTGMRLGEIQALTWNDITTDHINVKNSWDRKYGLVPPKAGSKRIVPLPSSLSEWIKEYKKSVPDKQDQFVFPKSVDTGPIDHKLISKRFYEAMSKIGINDGERNRRNITFHSWRHTFESHLRGTLADADLRKVTGHKTAAMTDHYDHQTFDALERVRTKVAQLFD